MKHIQLKPVITEKSLRLVSESQFTFRIPRYSNKLTIERAVEQAYKVHVIDVNIAKTAAKPKRNGVTSPKIKAIIRLKKGEKIPGFELPVETPAQKSEEK
ncbi:50S ribosomal protein L23 [Candidatus Berkelbacteria bacterium]|nr:50S ribosomal protein L23 [Candidatus Berkelbacteria bacterium]